MRKVEGRREGERWSVIGVSSGNAELAIGMEKQVSDGHWLGEKLASRGPHKGSFRVRSLPQMVPMRGQIQPLCT